MLTVVHGEPADPETTIDNVRPDVATRLAAIRNAMSHITVEQFGLLPGGSNIQMTCCPNRAPLFWRNGNWHPGYRGWTLPLAYGTDDIPH